MDALSNAAASVWIDAQPDDVWIALTESSRLRRWLGAELRSDWRRGSPLVWDGDEAGEVLEAAPGLGLALRRGEHGPGLRFALAGEDGGTRVSLHTEAGGDDDAVQRDWRDRLEALRRLVEQEHGERGLGGLPAATAGPPSR